MQFQRNPFTREVRLLLAGPYYFDVDMVNNLPNVARQLGQRGMVRETSLQALSKLCSERDSVLKDIVEFYGLVDATAQGPGGHGARPG